MIKLHKTKNKTQKCPDLLKNTTCLGVDCCCDHVPEVTTFISKLQKAKNRTTNISVNLVLLKSNLTINVNHTFCGNNKLEAPGEVEDLKQYKENFKTAVTDAATGQIPKAKEKEHNTYQ